MARAYRRSESAPHANRSVHGRSARRSHHRTPPRSPSPNAILPPPPLSSRRHVILPKALATSIPKKKLLSESEWRGIGVQQSRGWVHYAIHRPEPHILLFRRPLGTDPRSGHVDADAQRKAKERYFQEYGIVGENAAANPAK